MDGMHPTACSEASGKPGGPQNQIRQMTCPKCGAQVQVRQARFLARKGCLSSLVVVGVVLFLSYALGGTAVLALGVVLTAALLGLSVLRTQCTSCGEIFFSQPGRLGRMPPKPGEEVGGTVAQARGDLRLAIRDGIRAGLIDSKRQTGRFALRTVTYTLIFAAVIVFLGVLFWGKPIPVMLVTVWNMKWLLLGGGAIIAFSEWR